MYCNILVSGGCYEPPQSDNDVVISLGPNLILTLLQTLAN